MDNFLKTDFSAQRIESLEVRLSGCSVSRRVSTVTGCQLVNILKSFSRVKAKK
jgi:hypothetical protein